MKRRVEVNKVRVLQFITPAGFYGAERWVLALANNINTDRVVCDLAVSKESPGQDLSVATHYPKSAGEVHYLSMSNRFDLRVVQRLVKLIKSRKIEVIHTHGYKSDILGLLAAKICRIRCVSTPHGFSGNVGLKLGAFIRVGTFMLRYFDAVVPLSEELIEDVKRVGVSAEKTQFIRNGVDLKEIDAVIARLRQEQGKGWQQQSSGRIVGFIGQLIPRKGLPDLLQVFDRLHGENCLTRLQLLGDGAQRQELEGQAAKLNSVNAIEFLGFRSDRLALLSGFSVFVMTSSLEGIPRCMMEAMAVGVPIVAYDIPGVDQLIEHNITGMLAPYGDKEELLRCCKKVLDNPGFAQQLTSAAREKVDKTYSAARMAEEYEVLFRQILTRY
jgi:glycosyltransferase involved in cell wall biosynthesis